MRLRGIGLVAAIALLAPVTTVSASSPDSKPLDDSLAVPRVAPPPLTATVDLVSLDIAWEPGDTVGAVAVEAPKEVVEVPTSSGTTEAMIYPADGTFPGTPEGSGEISSIVNGSVPSNMLTTLSWLPHVSGYSAAVPFLEAMNEAYREDTGRNLAINNMYRPGYQGRSFHGWGIAIDFDSPDGELQYVGDSQYNWLMANGHRFGFYLPFWAGSNGSNPEPWHWEIGSYYRGNDSDCYSACPANRPLWVKH